MADTLFPVTKMSSWILSAANCHGAVQHALFGQCLFAGEVLSELKCAQAKPNPGIRHELRRDRIFGAKTGKTGYR
jgi:hypothetical protein